MSTDEQGHWTLQKQKEDQRHAAAITAGASPTVSDELSLTKAKAKGGLSRKKRKCSSADSEGAPTRQVESELTPPKEGAADGVVIDEYDAEMQQVRRTRVCDPLRFASPASRSSSCHLSLCTL